MMRKYQPIWDAIKTSVNYTVSIAAPTPYHARIIQAVRKEKVKDLGWSLLISEKGNKYRMSQTVEGNLITFYLTDISL